MILKNVKLDDVKDDEYRMRVDYNDVKYRELCESIRKDGVIQPIILKTTLDGYAVVAGHRRCLAAREVNLVEIPALIAEYDEREAWNIAFTENLFRKDLSPIEEAVCIRDCIESELYTVETIAKMLGRSAGWVLGRMELVDWPAVLTKAVHVGALSVTAARWIAKIDDAAQVELLTMYAVENGATERATQAWYQSYMATKSPVIPEDVEPLDTAKKVQLPEPQSPCVICQKVRPMRELSYLPVCSDCGENLIQLARAHRDVGDVS